MTEKDSDIQFFNGIRERDIHAYIDGHLDARREKLVEAYLDHNPEVAAEVRDYIEYNMLLKEAYAPVEEEDVPARLMAALNRPARNFWQPMMKMAAVVALCALSVGLGRMSAYQGQDGAAGNEMVNHFLQQIATNSAGDLYTEASLATLDVGTNVEADPLNWLTQKLALEMQAPDLASAGYVMTGRRLVTRGTQEFVELTYQGDDQKELQIYMKTRWDKQPPAVEFAHQDGTSIAYWQEGPLVYAVTGVLNEQNATEIAGLVRESMASMPKAPQQVQELVIDRPPSPVMQPNQPAMRDQLIGNDGFLPPVNTLEGQGSMTVPVLPQNIEAIEHIPSAH